MSGDASCQHIDYNQMGYARRDRCERLHVLFHSYMYRDAANFAQRSVLRR